MNPTRKTTFTGKVRTGGTSEDGENLSRIYNRGDMSRGRGTSPHGKNRLSMNLNVSIVL